ncbi:recombinase family protein [Streptomyces chrestomyceticus]|uniref:recombinase family protein n=1 Tax=Streptomyces chrestomyceticus TaxID=68185 RepID=UPI0035A838BF
MRRQILDDYARESAAGDRRNVSITGQHQINVRRIEDLGALLGEQLDDKGKSAWKPGVFRGDWEKLIKRMESGESDGAVIFDIERFLRTVEEAFRIVAVVRKARDEGRRVMIYDSDGEFDLTTPQGEKNFYDAAVSAQYYSHRLSTKVQRGNRQKAERGEGRRGRYRPFGFEEDGHTVRESERPYAREAVRRVLHGGTWQEACDYLNGEKVYSSAQDHTDACQRKRDEIIGIKYRQYSCTCPQRPWEPVSLRSCLLAPRMAGYVKLGPGRILGRLPGEPIIDPVDWHALHALVQSRRGRPPMAVYLCSGKDSPVRCKDCGGHFTIQTDSKKKVYEDGTLRRHYRCHKSAAGGCGKTIADWRALDKAISAIVIDRLSRPEQIEQIRSAQEARRQQRKPHEDKIARLEELQRYRNQRLNEEQDSPEEHSYWSADLKARIQAEKEKLARIEKAPMPTVDIDALDDIRKEWKTATPAKRKERLRQAYSGYQIFVTPGSSTEDDVRERISAPVPIPSPKSP